MSQELLYWQALNRAMDHAMAADESVFTLGEDVGLYGGSYRVTEGLYAKYGEWRVRDTPISEGGFTGLGVGAALVGVRPVVEIMTINFMLLALDSIINGAAKIPFMSGRPVQDAAGRARAWRRRPPARGATCAAARAHDHECARACALPCRRRRRTPIGSCGRRSPATIRSSCSNTSCLYFTKGQVDVMAEAPPMHRAVVRREGRDLTIISYSRHARPGAGSRGRTRQGRHRSRSHRSAQPQADRLGHLREVSREDPSRACRRGGLPLRRRRRGNRGNADRALLLFARRAHSAAGRSRHSDAVQRRAGSGDDSASPRHRRGGAGTVAAGQETKAA